MEEQSKRGAQWIYCSISESTLWTKRCKCKSSGTGRDESIVRGLEKCHDCARESTSFGAALPSRRSLETGTALTWCGGMVLVCVSDVQPYDCFCESDFPVLESCDVDTISSSETLPPYATPHAL